MKSKGQHLADVVRDAPPKKSLDLVRFKPYYVVALSTVGDSVDADWVLIYFDQ